ncbi:hypothetical protein ACQKEK_09510 [Pseudomonas sp. NPDC077408]
MNPHGFPIDALSISVARADAVLLLLAAQFDAPDGGSHSAEVNSEAIGVVRAELAAIRALIAEQMEATA